MSNLFIPALAVTQEPSPPPNGGALTGIAGLLVPLIAAVFVGLSKVLSMYMAGKRQQVEASSQQTIADLKLELAILQAKHALLQELYNNLREPTKKV